MQKKTQNIYEMLIIKRSTKQEVKKAKKKTIIM